MTTKIYKLELTRMTSILLLRRRSQIKQQKKTIRYDTRSTNYSQDSTE